MSGEQERKLLERRAKGSSFLIEMLQRGAMTALTVLVAEGTRRSLGNFIDGRFPDGRLAVGYALAAHQGRL